MANIDRIVNVAIDLRTSAIRQQSFSDMLVIGPHVLSTSRIMIVTSGDDLLELGMAATDPIYLAVNDAFSQIPCVPQVYVGRRLVDSVTASIDSFAQGSVYRIKLGWTSSGTARSYTATYTAPSGANVTSVITGIVTQIGLSGAPVAGSNSGGALQIASDGSGSAFTVLLTGPMTMIGINSTEPWANALAACRAEDNTWYGIVASTRIQSSILSIADWAEANGKLFVTAVAENGAGDATSTSDTVSMIKTGDYFRTAAFYHGFAATDFPDAAEMSKNFTKYPGQDDWANVTLSGITADGLTETFSSVVRNKNGNTFEPFRNSVSMTQGGRTGGGEWIDVIRFRDWLVEQIKVNVFTLMVDNRIPYTDHGILLIEAQVRAALDLGVRRTGIAEEELDDKGKVIPSYTISVPRSANVPFNDKANRVLNDVTFVARLAGAIHAVKITGTLSYSL